MDNKINNRLEAFLSWIATGVKPEGWDLEPRNKEENFLATKADRIDQIEQGGGPTPPPPPAGPTDYNELINKPIDPYPTDRPIIPIEGSEITIEAGMTLHGDDTKVDDMVTYLQTLTYTSMGPIAPEMCMIAGDLNEKDDPAVDSIVALKFPSALTQLDHDIYFIVLALDDSGDMNPNWFFFVSEDYAIGGGSFTKGYQKDIDFITTSAVPVNQNIDIETFNSMVSLLGAPDVDAGTYYYKAGQPAGDKLIVAGDVLGGEGGIQNIKIPSSNFDPEFLATLSYEEQPGSGINKPMCPMLSMMVMAVRDSEFNLVPYNNSESELWTTIYFDITVSEPEIGNDAPNMTFINVADHSKVFYLYSIGDSVGNTLIYFTKADHEGYDPEQDVLVYDGTQFLMDHYILKNFETKGSSTDKNFNHDTLEGLYQIRTDSKFRNRNNCVYDIDPTVHPEYVYTGLIDMLLYAYVSNASNIGIPIFPGTYNLFDANGLLCGRVSNVQGTADVSTLDKHTFMNEYIDLSEADFTMEVPFVYGNYYTLVPAVSAELSLGNKKVLLANEAGSHVYKHNINFNYDKYDSSKTGSLTIYNNDATELTGDTLYTYLKSNGYTVSSDFYAGNSFYPFSSTNNHFGITTYRDFKSFDLLSVNGSIINNYSIGYDSGTILDFVETIL